MNVGPRYSNTLCSVKHDSTITKCLGRNTCPLLGALGFVKAIFTFFQIKVSALTKQ